MNIYLLIWRKYIIKTLFYIKGYSLLIFIFLFIFQFREIKAQFANGADVGWLSQMEDEGYIFKDNSGVQKNCLDILKEKGINALRFRVWVNPSGAYCDKKDVAYMAHRADSMGFKVMIDFHYSDDWADPGKQYKPAAWIGHTLSQLLLDIYNYTYNVLDTLKSLGVIPKWVQIGNEVNDGMLWEDGRASTHMNNFAAMVNSAYNAVKAIDSTIQIVIHLSNGHDDAMYRWMFDGLKNNGAKWDVIGMSVYPYWADWPNGLPWSVDDSLSLITMEDMIIRYNTKVIVCEAGYLYNQPVEANHYLLDLIEKTKSVGGLGVFYWEPECYNWPLQNHYNLGAWDPITKKPTAALDAFLGLNATSIKEEKKSFNFELNIYPNPFNPNITIEYSLQKSSETSIDIYNTLGEEVARLVDRYVTAGSHRINWSAQNFSSGIYFCRIISGNFLETKKIVLLR
jgi:arabinogalactan endo-1,4-beta-galactosidase